MTLDSQKVEILVISRSNRILLILLLLGNISSDLGTHINITSTANADINVQQMNITLYSFHLLTHRYKEAVPGRCVLTVDDKSAASY